MEGRMAHLYAGALVREYLQRCGLEKTLEVFDAEQKRQSGSKPSEQERTDAWYSMTHKLGITEYIKSANLRSLHGTDISIMEGMIHMLHKRVRNSRQSSQSPRKKNIKEDPLSPTTQMRKRRVKQQEEKARQLLALGVDLDSGRDLLADNSNRRNRRNRGQKAKQNRRTEAKERAEADLSILQDERISRLLSSTSRVPLSSNSLLQQKIMSQNQALNIRSKESWIPMDIRMRSLKRSIEVARENFSERHGHETLIEKKREQARNQKDQAKLREQMTARSKKKKYCALCEKEFAEINLPFVVTYKAIMDVRLAWGVEIRPNPKFGKFPHWYKPVQCCVFCSQFFSTDGGIFNSEHRGLINSDVLTNTDKKTLSSMNLIEEYKMERLAHPL